MVIRTRDVQVVFALLAVSMSQTVVASASKFDLTCKGIKSGTSAKGVYRDVNIKLPSMRLIIDLDRKLWCFYDCQSVGTIDVKPLTLSLVGGPAIQDDGLRIINRQHGTYSTDTIDFYGTHYIIDWQCKRAEFTGLPSNRF